MDRYEYDLKLVEIRSKFTFIISAGCLKFFRCVASATILMGRPMLLEVRTERFVSGKTEVTPQRTHKALHAIVWLEACNFMYAHENGPRETEYFHQLRLLVSASAHIPTIASMWNDPEWRNEIVQGYMYYFIIASERKRYNLFLFGGRNNLCDSFPYKENAEILMFSQPANSRPMIIYAQNLKI